MKDLLTHVATADCLITLPHAALQCGIVTAWWRFWVEGGAVKPLDQGSTTSQAEKGGSRAL